MQLIYWTEGAKRIISSMMNACHEDAGTKQQPSSTWLTCIACCLDLIWPASNHIQQQRGPPGWPSIGQILKRRDLTMTDLDAAQNLQTLFFIDAHFTRQGTCMSGRRLHPGLLARDPSLTSVLATCNLTVPAEMPAIQLPAKEHVSNQDKRSGCWAISTGFPAFLQAILQFHTPLACLHVSALVQQFSICR
jgi:hypothetical protein